MTIQFEKGGKGFDEFVATIRKIELVPSSFLDNTGNKTNQWHIEMEPEDKTIFKNGKTGAFHEYISDKHVEGSNLDKYIQECVVADRDLKGAATVEELFKLMKGRKYLFIKKKLGKAFNGMEAAERWVPRSKA